MRDDGDACEQQLPGFQDDFLVAVVKLSSSARETTRSPPYQVIPPEGRTCVTERFVRLDESRSKPGNGLGLSLVSGVMKLHKGTLVLEDNGPGLRARLVLQV